MNPTDGFYFRLMIIRLFELSLSDACKWYRRKNKYLDNFLLYKETNTCRTVAFSDDFEVVIRAAVDPQLDIGYLKN